MVNGYIFILHPLLQEKSDNILLMKAKNYTRHNFPASTKVFNGKKIRNEKNCKYTVSFASFR